MSYSAGKDKNKGVVILEKQEDAIFNDTNGAQGIKKYGSDAPAGSYGKMSYVKDFFLNVEYIVNSEGREPLNVKKYLQLKQILPVYMDSETQLYSKKLLSDIKNGKISLDFMKDYSIIIIGIKYKNSFEKCKSNDDLDRYVEKNVVENIMQDKIPIRYSENKLLVILPAVKREALINLIKRGISPIGRQNIINDEIGISVGFACKYKNANFQEVLNDAESNMHEAGWLIKYLRFELETDISARIETVRKELHNMISMSESVSDSEIIEMSQYLDKLLVKYLREEDMDSSQ